MRSTQERRCRSNRGFTLVEMIVTMMLLSILLTISVMGLMAWQDWSDFNQANEYAETMFLAAQNQLSEYNANGTLEDFAKQTKNFSPAEVKLDSIYYEEGQAYSDDSVWVTVNKGTLVSVRANKGDYSLYAAGKDTTSPTAPIVYQLLQGYLYDTSILNDAICVEFSLEDGQVFSVLYSAKSNGDEVEIFEYDNDNDSLRGSVNIATRYDSYRKDRMIGYYGVDTLSTALKGTKEKPSIDEVKLNNEDTLNLSFKVSKPANAAQKMNYDITVYDVDSDFCTSENMADGVPVMKFTLNGAKIKNYANRQAQNCAITRYVKDETGTWSAQELGEFPVLAWSDTDGTIRVVLDAADFQATSASYEMNLSILRDTSKASKVANANFKFKSTYTFHRFGLDANKIKCSIKGYGAAYDTTTERQSNQSYVYFAEENNNTDAAKKVVNYNYSIANARHLYNMRYVTDITANTEKSVDELRLSSAHYEQDTKKTLACHFQLAEDIDWTKFVASGAFYNTNGNDININLNDETESLAESFISMKQLRAEDSLDGKNTDGESYTIKGLTISQAGNALCRLYTDTDTGKADDEKKPVGLFVTNYGKIGNLKLDEVQITSPGDYVGSFAGITMYGKDLTGETAGILENLEVVNDDVDAETASFVKGKSYVGGITGTLIADSDSVVSAVTWKELSNAAKVTGLSHVGGVVGELRTEKNRSTAITLEDCENTGAVYAVVKDGEDKKDSKFVGGIAGSCVNEYAANHTDDTSALANITIKNSNSTPFYSRKDLQAFLGNQDGTAFATYADKVAGTYVGGITGYSYFSTLQGVRAELDNGKHSYVFGHDYVGGIVGYATGSAELSGTDDTNTNGRNDNYVIGCSYVGGVIGANADIDLTKTQEDTGNSSGDTLVLVEKGASPIVVSDTVNSKNTVSNWQNTGVVYATGMYAGGISGYNTGSLLENLDTSGAVTVAGEYPVSHAADYVGGITGYNHGVIKAEARKDNNVRIVGKNYVGGIVGYNDSGAEVTNYAVTAGSINGDTDKGSYVGGLAGCNASILMLQKADGSAKQLYVSTQNISGKYFVGGVIGANIINTNGYNQNVQVEQGQGDSSNVADGTSAGNTSKLCYVTLTEYTHFSDGKSGQFYFTVHNDSDKKIDSWYIVMHVPNGTTHYSGPQNLDEIVTIGEKETTFQFTPTQNSYKEIPAHNVSNPSQNHFQISFPTKKDYYSFDITDIEFFYTGGDGNKAVTKPGNLAITEKNKHEVIGLDDPEYKLSITGNQYLGNIQLSNNSDNDIFDISIELPMENNGDLEIDMYDWAKDSLNCEKKSRVVDGKEIYYWEISPKSDNQNFVRKANSISYGGVTFNYKSQEVFDSICRNAKVIFYTSKLTQQTDEVQYYRIKTDADMSDFRGTITGSAFTGGYIGYTMLVNSTDTTYARTTAENVRKLTLNQPSEETVVDKVCNANVQTSEVQMYVTGTVGGGSVTSDTYVGGLVGYDDANTFLRIENAKNRAAVTAKTGYAGGMISASRKSNNKILTSNNYGTITAKEVAGGIVGENKGTVNQCNVSATIVGNRGTSIASYGGIVGVSGIATEKAEDTDAAQVMECTFTGSVSGAGDGVTANVGGIVGANGYNSTVKANTIGSADTVVHGGMVDGTAYETARANAGGIVGTNYGTVSLTDNSQKEEGNTTIDNYLGYTGGIVGCNQKDAVVKGTATEQIITAGTWHVTAKVAGENTAVGGIIGHSMSGENLEYLTNYAEVKTTATGNIAVGGIVGQMENQTSDAMTFTKCNNYGTVTGTWYTGGMIGYLRYRGVKFNSCTSDGAVTGGTSVDAMVGYADADIESNIQYADCTVNGTKYSKTTQIASNGAEEKQVVMDASEGKKEAETTAGTMGQPDETENAVTDADTQDSTTEATTEEIQTVQKLETPDVKRLADDVRVLQYYDGTKWTLTAPVQDEDLVGTYESRAYRFEVQDGTDYYEVQIKDASGAYGVLYVQPKTDKYYVYYAGSNAKIRRESLCEANPYTEFAGILTEEKPISVSYAVNVRLEDTTTAICAKVVAEENQISVLLPDTTTFVAVQAVVGEAHLDAFESSDVAMWKLIPVDDATTTDASAIMEAEEMDMVIWTGTVKKEAAKTELPKFAGTTVTVGSGTTQKEVVNYTVAIEQPMLVQVLGFDAEGTLVQSVYYTADQTSASFILEKDTWFTEDVKDVQIRFAAISEDGLAEWTQPQTLTITGISK
jgi:prepilin-type N-terminal cleavage/methylation domain-containing protein